MSVSVFVSVEHVEPSGLHWDQGLWIMRVVCVCVCACVCVCVYFVFSQYLYMYVLNLHTGFFSVRHDTHTLNTPHTHTPHPTHCGVMWCVKWEVWSVCVLVMNRCLLNTLSPRQLTPSVIVSECVSVCWCWRVCVLCSRVCVIFSVHVVCVPAVVGNNCIVFVCGVTCCVFAMCCGVAVFKDEPNTCHGSVNLWCK